MEASNIRTQTSKTKIKMNKWNTASVQWIHDLQNIETIPTRLKNIWSGNFVYSYIASSKKYWWLMSQHYKTQQNEYSKIIKYAMEKTVNIIFNNVDSLNFMHLKQFEYLRKL